MSVHRCRVLNYDVYPSLSDNEIRDDYLSKAKSRQASNPSSSKKSPVYVEQWLAKSTKPKEAKVTIVNETKNYRNKVPHSNEQVGNGDVGACDVQRTGNLRSVIKPLGTRYVDTKKSERHVRIHLSSAKSSISDKFAPRKTEPEDSTTWDHLTDIINSKTTASDTSNIRIRGKTSNRHVRKRKSQATSIKRLSSRSIKSFNGSKFISKFKRKRNDTGDCRKRMDSVSVLFVRNQNKKTARNPASLKLSSFNDIFGFKASSSITNPMIYSNSEYYSSQEPIRELSNTKQKRKICTLRSKRKQNRSSEDTSGGKAVSFSKLYMIPNQSKLRSKPKQISSCCKVVPLQDRENDNLSIICSDPAFIHRIKPMDFPTGKYRSTVKYIPQTTSPIPRCISPTETKCGVRMVQTTPKECKDNVAQICPSYPSKGTDNYTSTHQSFQQLQNNVPGSHTTTCKQGEYMNKPSNFRKVMKLLCICLLTLIWLPCILVGLFCWLLTYPIRPHNNHYRQSVCRVPGQRKRQGNCESFARWVKNRRWADEGPFQTLSSLAKNDEFEDDIRNDYEQRTNHDRIYPKRNEEKPLYVKSSNLQIINPKEQLTVSNSKRQRPTQSQRKPFFIKTITRSRKRKSLKSKTSTESQQTPEKQYYKSTDTSPESQKKPLNQYFKSTRTSRKRQKKPLNQYFKSNPTSTKGQKNPEKQYYKSNPTSTKGQKNPEKQYYKSNPTSTKGHKNPLKQFFKSTRTSSESPEEPEKQYFKSNPTSTKGQKNPENQYFKSNPTSTKGQRNPENQYFKSNPTSTKGQKNPEKQYYKSNPTSTKGQKNPEKQYYKSNPTSTKGHKNPLKQFFKSTRTSSESSEGPEKQYFKSNPTSTKGQKNPEKQYYKSNPTSTKSQKNPEKQYYKSNPTSTKGQKNPLKQFFKSTRTSSESQEEPEKQYFKPNPTSTKSQKNPEKQYFKPTPTSTKNQKTPLKDFFKSTRPESDDESEEKPEKQSTRIQNKSKSKTALIGKKSAKRSRKKTVSETNEAQENVFLRKWRRCKEDFLNAERSTFPAKEDLDCYTFLKRRQKSRSYYFNLWWENSKNCYRIIFYFITMCLWFPISVCSYFCFEVLFNCFVCR